MLSKPLLPPLPAERESDCALLAGLGCADASAFDALYEAYFPRIYNYFRRQLEKVTEVERATEAALTAVFREVSSAPLEMPLDRWIFRQVRGLEFSRDEPPQGSAQRGNLKVRPPRGGASRSG